MSAQNFELVRELFETYNAWDLDAHLALYAPDAEFVPDASTFTEAAPVQGRDEIRAWLEEAANAWVAPRYVLIEVLALGTDRVLARGEWGGQGAGSGIETYSSLTGVWTVRHGQISRVEFFFDHDAALKAVGLAE
jgi:ketosteroid isomerase-like protein